MESRIRHLLVASGLFDAAAVATHERALRSGAGDIIEGVVNWRIWHLIGTSELRRRYSRSTLGQFWLTLSTAVTVVTLGMVWSLLWKMSIAELLPFFAISFVVWNFMSAFLSEATTVFVGSSMFFMNQRMTFSTVILALTYRNLITLAHNSVIVILVLVFFAIPLTWSSLLAVPGLVLTTLTGFFVAYLVAMASLRYRDLVQLVGNVVQILFFITPVMWKEALLPVDQRWIVDYNPFAIFLSIVRDPILGAPIPVDRWWTASAITIAAGLIAIYVVGRLRRRIIYWI